MTRPHYCTCKQQDLAVVVYICGDAGDARHMISITCTRCHRPVFIELRASVESEDLAMRLDREVDGDSITYKLRSEPRP